MIRVRGLRKVRRWGALVGAGGLLGVSACDADGLIGGDCADGYAFCDGACIGVTEDEENCGACDVPCPSNLACIEALCGGPDGHVTVGSGGAMGGEGGTDSGGSTNSGGTDGSGGADTGGSGGDGGGDGVGGAESGGAGGAGSGGMDPGGGSGGMEAGGSGGMGNGGSGGTGTGGGGPCLPPFVTASACGDCSTQCSGGTPNCAPDGFGSYECVPACNTAPYLTECSNSCVDTDTDPRHCGVCNNRCPSGICEAGSCVGNISGHMVALCMSLEEPATGPTKLLANSVFLASENPVRILAYVNDTSPGVKAGADSSLVQAAVNKGRTFQKTEVTASDAIETQLNRLDYDALIVYDQDLAPSGDILTMANASAGAVQLFAEQGGIVVVLTGGGGTSEMHELLDAWGIANASGTTNYDGGTYSVDAPGDAVGVAVVTPFLGVETSCIFDVPGMPPSDVVYVVTATEVGPNDGSPAVIHRIVTP